MEVCCVFSLESPHRGDSNEYTQYTIFNIKKENHPKLSLICSYGFLFQGTQERVRNSRGKRAISVRASEVQLYIIHRRPKGQCLYGIELQMRDSIPCENNAFTNFQILIIYFIVLCQGIFRTCH